jgi:hypothetical protein
MYCATSSEMQMNNTFTANNNGCSNFRTSTLTRHLSGKDHCEATKRLVMRRNFNAATTTALTKNSEVIVSGMKAVYWLCKEGLPLSKFPSLMDFMQCAGVHHDANIGKNATYTSRETAQEYLEAIAEIVTEDINDKVKAAAAVSVLIDESTDIKTQKKLVICVKTVDNYLTCCTHHLGNIEITDISCTAEVIFNKLKDFLSKRSIQTATIVGFGSDGASIMTGSKNGVATRLKRDSPFLISVHCMAHRLNLVTEKAAKEEPFTNSFQKMLSDIFYYFKKSTARILQLKQIQEILDLPEIRMKEVHEIRWISFYKALESIYRTYTALVKFFSGKTDSKAKAIHVQLINIRFVYCLHMLMDIIPSFAQLSMIMQKQHLDIAAVQPCVKATTDAIKKVTDNKSHYLEEFLKKDKVFYKSVQLNTERH